MRLGCSFAQDHGRTHPITKQQSSPKTNCASSCIIFYVVASAFELLFAFFVPRNQPVCPRYFDDFFHAVHLAFSLFRVAAFWCPDFLQIMSSLHTRE